MSNNWAADCEKSRDAFVSIVWPHIARECGGGELVQTEGSQHHTDRDLDMLAGIDGYQSHSKHGMRGIASRVQFVRSDPWNTFTIRLSRNSGTKTEYEKRLTAINGERGWLFAHLTVQAYLSMRGDLLSAAVVRTADLFRHTEACKSEAGKWEHPDGCYENSTTNASFLVVPWDHLASEGVEIKLISHAACLQA